MNGAPSLSRPARRVLALALLAALPLLGWAALVAPVLSAQDGIAARTEHALALEQRALAIGARAPALTAEVAALREALAGVVALPAGTTHALAGAELQRLLRASVSRHGGAVLSIETLAEREGEGVVAVRARLQASADGLRDILAELEAGPGPLLQVHSLSVGAPAPASYRGPGRLEAQLELRGLRRAARDGGIGG